MNFGTFFSIKIDRIAGYISRMTDTGVFRRWEDQTWSIMRRDVRERADTGGAQQHTQDPDDNCKEACPLRMDHLLGTLVIMGSILACGAVSLAGEVLLNRLSCRSDDEEGEANYMWAELEVVQKSPARKRTPLPSPKKVKEAVIVVVAPAENASKEEEEEEEQREEEEDEEEAEEAVSDSE